MAVVWIPDQDGVEKIAVRVRMPAEGGFHVKKHFSFTGLSSKISDVCVTSIPSSSKSLYVPADLKAIAARMTTQ